MKTTKKDICSEKRDDPRIKYFGHIFFSNADGFYEGDLINYSEHGLFIKTPNILQVGSVITIALPYLDGHVKRQGQVVRTTNDGFGIELFKEKCDAFETVSLREMKIQVE